MTASHGEGIAMAEDLIAAVLERAGADEALTQEALTQEAQLLVLAAGEGDADLADALREPRPTPAVPPAVPQQPKAPPVQAYLSAVTVEGFRGVGAPSRLSFTPGPGLVLAEPKEAAARLAKDLKLELTGVADPRAVVAVAQLRKTKPDLAAVRALIAGDSTGQSGDLTRLRALVDVPSQPADPATFAQAGGRYERAVRSAERDRRRHLAPVCPGRG